MKRITFVCTGNTCRSPIAEAMLREQVTRSPLLEGLIQADSAGTMAAYGAPMSRYSAQALQSLGYLPHTHLSKQLTPGLIEASDLILGLTAQHIAGLQGDECAKGKIHTLKGYGLGVEGCPAGNAYNIEDPFGQPLHVYEAVAREIEEAVRGLVHRLERTWAK